MRNEETFHFSLDGRVKSFGWQIYASFRVNGHGGPVSGSQFAEIGSEQDAIKSLELN